MRLSIACGMLMGFVTVGEGVAMAQEAVTTAGSVADDRARPTILISDVHLGLGRQSSSEWHPYEDARWPMAWRGFLSDIDAAQQQGVDLVILGDFLELWQPFEGMACTTLNADLGCTEVETLTLAQRVLAGHSEELKALDAFLISGTNRLYLVPGNHDAALLLPNVRTAFLAEFSDAATKRIVIETDGIWTSANGKIVGEHGHQIGKDVNRYAAWPSISAASGDTRHVIRPWGEQFVQTLFNDVEAEYPLIDNLGPESAGARYRLADKGLVKTAADLAKFLAFNLFQTSVRQKGMVLSNEYGELEKWDVVRAKELGYKLIIGGLPSDDPMSALVIDSTAESEAIREQLTAEVQKLSNDELFQLCDHAAIQGRVRCAQGVLSGTLESLFNTKQSVVKKHLASLETGQPSMNVYVYGHTHQYETPWTVRLDSNRAVTVVNTGAFQRVIGEEGFKRRMKERGLKPADALKGIHLDDLPACYTFVEVNQGAQLSTQLWSWAQKEGQTVGRRLGPSDPVCQ